jgi:4-amino-4-deoxy-L-arabinose transferase-like glycosyltransferase
MSRRLAWAALVAVLAGSFAFHAYRAEHPTTGYQSADERSYGKLAVGIADQHRYGGGLTDPLHWPPGAPVAFALGHELFPDARSATTADIPAAYWIQALASLGTAIAAAALAWLLAGAWAGVAAAAVVGLYPPLILATGEQISEPLGAFWLTLAFALFVVAARRGRAWVFALGGLAMGAAVLTRADLLPVPFVLAALVAVWTWRSGRDLRRALVVGGCILGGAVLAIAPWTVYASQRAGELVPVTRGSASALFVGTYLPGNGTTVGMKRALGAAVKRRNPRLRHVADFDLEARSVLAVVAARHPHLDFNAAVSLEARRNISRYVRQDPLGFGRMMLNKVQRMWSRYARGGARHTSPFIRGWHILLVLLAVAGLVAGIARRRSLLLGCILGAALTSTAVHMLVVSQARYNLPLMPALLAGGVAGWALFARGHSRDERLRRPCAAGPVHPAGIRSEELRSAGRRG